MVTLTYGGVQMILNLIKSAIHLFYDNSKSGLTATNVQGAIDEVQGNVNNKLIYKDISFTGNSVPANGNHVITNISIVHNGYKPISVTAFDCSDYGNGMAYIPILLSDTKCAVFVHNYNGGASYTAKGSLRIGYIKT